MGIVFSDDINELLGPDCKQALERLAEQEEAGIENSPPDYFEEFSARLDGKLNVWQEGESVTLLPEHLLPGPPTLEWIRSAVTWDYLSIHAGARDDPAGIYKRWNPLLPFSLPSPPAVPFNHVAGGTGKLNQLIRFNVFAGGQENGIYNESFVQNYFRHYVSTRSSPPTSISVTLASAVRKVGIDATVVTRIPFGSELSASLTGRIYITSTTPGQKDPDVTVKDSQGRVIAPVKPPFYDDWKLSFQAPNRKGKHVLNRTLPVSGKTYSFRPAPNTSYSISYFIELRVRSKGDWNSVWLKFEDDPGLMM